MTYLEKCISRTALVALSASPPGVINCVCVCVCVCVYWLHDGFVFVFTTVRCSVSEDYRLHAPCGCIVARYPLSGCPIVSRYSSTCSKDTLTMFPAAIIPDGMPSRSPGVWRGICCEFSGCQRSQPSNVTKQKKNPECVAFLQRRIQKKVCGFEDPATWLISRIISGDAYIGPWCSVSRFFHHHLRFQLSTRRECCYRDPKIDIGVRKGKNNLLGDFDNLLMRKLRVWPPSRCMNTLLHHVVVDVHDQRHEV